eukprot:6841189-Ditylum_brightwellii.AAC.1
MEIITPLVPNNIDTPSSLISMPNTSKVLQSSLHTNTCLVKHSKSLMCHGNLVFRARREIEWSMSLHLEWK